MFVKPLKNHINKSILQYIRNMVLTMVLETTN